jgi:NAD(P)-dependent dehydrogenase (short-subunit alcohol dehydrogenase family)
MMGIHVEHFDLSGRNALVLSVETPVGQAIAEAYVEAGARVTGLNTLPAGEVGPAVKRAAADMGGLQILASAPDRFLAKPVTAITPDELAEVFMANYTTQFYACQTGIDVMLQQGIGGNIVLVTHVLGERGLPNTSVYAAAHGAVHNLIRALAQEIAPHGISINGVALGWMDWMHDRLDRNDQEANRALRFPIIKRAGVPEDVGPIAVWLAGSGVGYVTGQIFPVDGGLTQHL